MSLGFFEKIYAKSEIKDHAAENKETFLKAAGAGGATQQQMEVLEAYYDASTELLLKNINQLDSDSTPKDVMNLMMELVVKDITSDEPGIISKKIIEKSGLDFRGQSTPTTQEDDLSLERFIEEILPRVDQGYKGIFDPEPAPKETQEQQPTKEPAIQEAEGKNDQTDTPPSITLDTINGGTPKVIADATQDIIQIGGVSASDYFASFSNPALAQERIEIAQIIDPATQPAAQIDETYTTTLAI